MKLNSLTAISPLDGRYAEKTHVLSPYFSEAALIATRVELETQYLIALSDFGIVRAFTTKEKKQLKNLHQLSIKDLQHIKDLEGTTRHDMKAVEYWMREKLKQTTLSDILEMIHVGLTSEDINNLAHRLMLKRSLKHVFVPRLHTLVAVIAKKAGQYKSLPMLARTHGQAAVPTTYGKELVNFAVRLHREVVRLEHFSFSGKLNGAVGNFSSLTFAFPDKDWITFSNDFIASYGLSPNLYTTQINTPEDIITVLQIFSRINGIMLDLDQDMWRYSSDGWVMQENKKGEIGSSTMPQKVNPIDFENSEGNCKLGNALLDGIIHGLATSRLQRDLSGSTILRNLGSALSYSLLALQSMLVGLERVSPNEKAMKEALSGNWSILTEAVQTILRKEGVSDAYTKIVSLSRGQALTEKEWKNMVKALPIASSIKKQLEGLTPEKYLGLATKLTVMAIKKVDI